MSPLWFTHGVLLPWVGISNVHSFESWRKIPDTSDSYFFNLYHIQANLLLWLNLLVAEEHNGHTYLKDHWKDERIGSKLFMWKEKILDVESLCSLFHCTSSDRDRKLCPLEREEVLWNKIHVWWYWICFLYCLWCLVSKCFYLLYLRGQ